MARKSLPRPQDRPLRALSQGELIVEFERALDDGDGVRGAHCIHENWMRGEFPQNIERALERLWRSAAATIPEWLPMRYVSWLPDAYEVSARFEASRRGKSNVYLVLLDYADRRGDPFGVYVGMSEYTPAQRFDQHKAGIRAAGSVLKRGIEVLTGPTLHLQHIARIGGGPYRSRAGGSFQRCRHSRRRRALTARNSAPGSPFEAECQGSQEPYDRFPVSGKLQLDRHAPCLARLVIVLSEVKPNGQ